MSVEVFFRAQCSGTCGRWVSEDKLGRPRLVESVEKAVEFPNRRLMRDKLEKFGFLSGYLVYCGSCAWDSAT